MTEETETYETIEKKEITEDLKNYVSTMREESIAVPLKRCSPDGVHEFITQEASSYSCKNIGTIENSVAKKAIDADLRTEINEIDGGIAKNSVGVKDKTISCTSEISLERLKDLLTSVVTKWVFQTTNSNVLKTFCARSSDENLIEIFVNFEHGDQGGSYISFGDKHAGYITGKTLEKLKDKLNSVYKTLTVNLDSTEIIWEEGIHRLEQVRLEDPMSWLLKKNEALLNFVDDDAAAISFMERFFNYFDFGYDNQLNFNFQNSEDTLCDIFVTDYLLNRVTLDIKQVYA